jgi:hypothetical protein
MENVLTKDPGRPLERPGRQATTILPPREPRPLAGVKSVNIVVKLLDATKFPIQASHLDKMLNDLYKEGLLEKVIGRNVMAVVREHKKGQTKFRPNVGDIIPKGHFIYALILDNGWMMLRHLRGRWFRALAYFIDHESCSEFLNICFTNNCHKTRA